MSDNRYLSYQERSALYKRIYNLSLEECYKGVQTACAFFGIPMPAKIIDQTGNPKEGTAFLNWDPTSYADDQLQFNLDELRSLGVVDYDSFTAVITHECAHRYFQNRTLPGINFGEWEDELVADFFLGVRASVENLKIDSVRKGLGMTTGAGTHPIGRLRYNYVRQGMILANFNLIQHKPINIEEFYQKFLEYRQSHLDELRQAEMTIF